MTPKRFKKMKICGGAGHRSPYLSHEKRALYHLSYTADEVITQLVNLFHEIMINHCSYICSGASVRHPFSAELILLFLNASGI